jgi:hypothetical protein
MHDREEMASNAFRKAVDRLWNIAGFYPTVMQEHRREIGDLLWFLDACQMAAPGYDCYGGEYRVRMAHFEELMRRKNPRHRGYLIAKDFVQSNLYCCLPPKSWKHEPPDVSLIEQYIGKCSPDQSSDSLP